MRSPILTGTMACGLIAMIAMAEAHAEKRHLTIVQTTDGAVAPAPGVAVAPAPGVPVAPAPGVAVAPAPGVAVAPAPGVAAQPQYAVVAPGITDFNKDDIIEITCPVKCDDLGVKLDGTVLKEKGKLAPSPWTSDALGDGKQLIVAFGASFTQTFVRQNEGQPPATDNGGPLIQPKCPTEIEDYQIAVDITGNVLASRVAGFTEEDELIVWVFGSGDTISQIKVVRRSPFRDVTVLRIQGEVKDVLGGLTESGGAPQIRCKRVQLTNFSAGRGQFAVIGASEAVLAEYEFAVHPIYDGMFTVAFIGTRLPNRSFSLRDDDMERTIVEDPSGHIEGRYALMYTAFLPLAHWFDRFENSAWNQAVGVSAGVLLDDPIDNFLFGASLGPVNGLSLVLGSHFGRVRELDGVSVGDMLPADSVIPTKNVWDGEFFIGMSLDIGVATKLFFSLLGPR